MDWAVRLPQRFLGSFALQGASSSVLKPHLDRKERKKEFRSKSGQINHTFCSVNHFLGKQAGEGSGRESRSSSCQLSGPVVQSICQLKQDPDKNSLCHL